MFPHWKHWEPSLPAARAHICSMAPHVMLPPPRAEGSCHALGQLPLQFAPVEPNLSGATETTINYKKQHVLSCSQQETLSIPAPPPSSNTGSSAEWSCLFLTSAQGERHRLVSAQATLSPILCHTSSVIIKALGRSQHNGCVTRVR